MGGLSSSAVFTSRVRASSEGTVSRKDVHHRGVNFKRRKLNRMSAPRTTVHWKRKKKDMHLQATSGALILLDCSFLKSKCYVNKVDIC